jgi:TPR repeat protein
MKQRVHSEPSRGRFVTAHGRLLALGVMALRGEGMAKDPECAKAFLRRADELHFDVDEFLQANQLRRP